MMNDDERVDAELLPVDSSTPRSGLVKMIAQSLQLAASSRDLVRYAESTVSRVLAMIDEVQKERAALVSRLQQAVRERDFALAALEGVDPKLADRCRRGFKATN